MIFEYTPSSNDFHGFQESFWRFTIPDQGIDQLFLVAGTVTDPRVSMDHTLLILVKFCWAMKERKLSTLSILRKFLSVSALIRQHFVAWGKPQLSITPMSGTIPAEGKIPADRQVPSFGRETSEYKCQL